MKGKQTLFTQAQDFYTASRFGDAQKSLELYLSSGPPLEQLVEAKFLQGRIFRALSDYDTARTVFEEAKELAEGFSQGLTAKALNLIASINSLTGDVPEALLNLKMAADIYSRERMLMPLASALNNAGDLLREASDFHGALKYLIEAHEILKGSRTNREAINLYNLASTYSDLEQYDQAEYFNNEAYLLALDLGETEIAVATSANLGTLYLKQKLYKEAQSAFKLALSESRKHRHTRQEIIALCGLGDIYTEMGRFNEAILRLKEALKQASGARDVPLIFATTQRLAHVYKEHSDADCALNYAQDGLRLAEEHGSDTKLQIAHERMAEAYEQCGEFEPAYEHLQKSRELELKIINARTDDKLSLQAVQFKVERLRSDAATHRQAKARAERLVAEKTEDLENAQLEIVSRLALAAELRDDDTGEHTKRVGRNAAILAYTLGLPIDEVRDIFIAARLHDVGKIGVPDTILLKPGRLTDAEFNVIKTHTTVGAKILENGHSSILKLAEQITLSHHERWDGCGYPQRLAGNDIPQAARIVAVADVLDALISERPYKEAWSLADALEEIYQNSGRQFDPHVVEATRLAFGSGLFDPHDSRSAGWDVLLKQLEQTSLRPIPQVTLTTIKNLPETLVASGN